MSPLTSKLCLIFCWCSVLFHSSCRGKKDAQGETGLRGVGLIPTESPSAASCESIAEVLLGNIDTFSTLVEFAFQADLASVLGDTEAEIYIAAPTNDAFDAFGELEPEIVSNLMTDEWKTHLQSLLLYHTVESGAFSERNDDDDTSSVTLTTLNGEDITITYTDDRDVFINNDASVVDDFVACESLVDVIDKVLIPSWVENSIVDRAIADEELSILVNLVVQAELAEILSSSGPYTVLAPSNDAFRELLASPSIDPSNVDINLIKGLLTFHVIDGIYSADEIVDGLELATLQGDAVVFAVDGDVVTVNGSLVTDVDILANNGIIHKIDGVLIPNISIPVVETPDESPSVAAPSETETLGTIIDVASADEDLSILVDAVVHAGLADTLSSAGPFTVFAPTDAVWTKALTNPDDITVLDADILKEILLYHTVAGTYTAADITDGLILTTVQGETIEFSIDGDVVMINDEVMVTGTDILASNGIIHTIDGILFPQAVLDPTEGPSDPTKDPSEIPGTIVDVASADEDLSILVEAVVHAGLVDTLSSAGPFTVFAPTNDVWTEGLTNPDDITVLDPEILKQVLLYHTVAGIYTAADITDGLILTTVQGETIEFSIDGDVVMINGNVMITETDILASNGVIHTVDNFLFPQSTEPTTEDPSDPVAAPETEPLGTIVDVASADEDLSILVEAVVHAGLVDTLSSAGPFTVFAPTNDVWTEGLTNPEDITVLDPEILKQVLLYHTVAGIYTAADITDGLILTTVQGETIEFSIDGDAVMINGNVMITGTDILASNGVIHTVDNFLFPQSTEPTTEDPSDPVAAPETEPLGTIVDVASADEDLSILVEAVVHAGLVDTLSSAGPFTVFAPTNDVWTEGLTNPEDITVLDPEILKQVLLYHTVAGIYTAADITDGLILTTVQGETIEFSIDGDAVMINGNVMITGTDILASNGVIHTVDNFLFPQSTEPTTEDPSDPVAAPETEPLGTIVDVASADEDLSILVEAVVHAGLVDTLSSAGPFTVFAPTNAVWTEALANPDVTELDVDILTEVLLYHTVAGTYTAADITDGLILTTVQGETIEFSIDGDAVMINGNVMITGTDILASNGVIHTIDGILFPQANEPEDVPMVSPNEPTEATTGTKNETSSEPTGTIIDVASGEDDLSILVNLIVQAGLVETLSSEGRFTVFAPTNSAFTTVFNDLGLDATDLGDVVDSEALSSILTYHVVAGIYKASDIIDGLTLTTVQGDTIEFGVSSDGVVTVNNEVISVTDIPASNGVIHTIAGVLFPGTV